MKIFLLSLLFSVFVLFSPMMANEPPVEIISENDFSKFYGRISDRNETGEILKILTENANIKLFQAGDKVNFYIANRMDENPCVAYIRDTEKNFMVISLSNIEQCWDQHGGIRRGAMVKIESKMLEKRILDANIYREVLIKRKNDYLSQLKEVNSFLLNFKQNKVEEVSKIEKAIVLLEQKKLKKLNDLNIKRKDYIHLQREINYRLDKLDEDIENFRIERVELLRDRWAKDHDLGKPVLERPIEMKNWPDEDRRFEF